MSKTFTKAERKRLLVALKNAKKYRSVRWSRDE
jgi:hypothetical protein